MLKRVAISLALIVGVFLGYVAMQSPDYVISRELEINAPAEKIFPYLNNSKLALQWSPWTEVDPKAKMNISGPEAGTGSRTYWDSEGDLGTGSATIIESNANQNVKIKLEYVKPFQMVQEAEYVVKPAGDKTVVTWLVRGSSPFLARVMCTFFNMDKHVGANFEKGLSNLKTLVEKAG